MFAGQKVGVMHHNTNKQEETDQICVDLINKIDLL